MQPQQFVPQGYNTPSAFHVFGNERAVGLQQPAAPAVAMPAAVQPTSNIVTLHDFKRALATPFKSPNSPTQLTGMGYADGDTVEAENDKRGLNITKQAGFGGSQAGVAGMPAAKAGGRATPAADARGRGRPPRVKSLEELASLALHKQAIEAGVPANKDGKTANQKTRAWKQWQINRAADLEERTAAVAARRAAKDAKK
jgi:hypothetical protein